jgi:hypothetical protein
MTVISLRLTWLALQVSLAVLDGKLVKLGMGGHKALRRDNLPPGIVRLVRRLNAAGDPREVGRTITSI